MHVNLALKPITADQCSDLETSPKRRFLPIGSSLSPSPCPNHLDIEFSYFGS